MARRPRSARSTGRRWVARLVVLGSITGGLAAFRQRKLAANTKLYGLP